MPETVQQKLSLLEQRVGPESKSPLFAQLASYYLLVGRAQDALRVCDEGIAHFPFYTTGHLIKAKVLLTMNMSAEARRELEVVREFLPTNVTINKFLTDIPALPGELPPQEAPGVKTVKPKAKPVVTSEPAHAVEAPPPPASIEPVAVEPAPVEPASQAPPPAEPPSLPVETSPAATDMFGLTSTEAPASAPELVAPPEPTGAFEAAGQLADPFGFTGLTSADNPPPEAAAPVAETPSPFAGFEAPPTTETPPTEAPPAEQAFTGLAPVSEEESFEQYASRKRAEWAGSENTISLEDFLGGIFPPPTDAPPTPAPPPPNEIEELTQKLQGAKKITPVINLSDKSTVTASDSESPASTGFVTPTLAEIYAKQGWFDDAIKAYRTLAANKPAEREKFEKRIQELEEQKKQSG
ncbi:MAG: hypothetical protein HY562_12990 [Ignavibacteriales bacterium]|nr:hypothetical protein [Ignavibacteriales bacterium]